MSKAQRGNTVRVHYTGTLEDGSTFDSSREREPIEFTIGAGEVLGNFEEAVIGLSPGESIVVDIPAAEAYGERLDDMVAVVNKAQFPDHITPEIGQMLEIPQSDNTKITVLVTDVTDSDVTLDANHPLAGEDLRFDIELAEIVS